MSKEISIHLYPNHTAEKIRCIIVVTSESMAKKTAKLQLRAKYIVKDSRSVNAEFIVYSMPITLSYGENEILIPRKSLTGYSYSGKNLNIGLHCEIVIANSIVFDTIVTEQLEILLDLKPRMATCASKLVNPKDYFSLRKNSPSPPALKRHHNDP